MADTFLKKIVQMLTPENEELIRWNNTGDSIVICDVNRFSRELLPKYFKTKKFNSFVRQLNFYGFKKVPISKTTRGCEFSHKLFKRGYEDRVMNMKRKIIHEMDYDQLNETICDLPPEEPQETKESQDPQDPQEQLDEKDMMIKQLTERCKELEKENEELRRYTMCCNNNNTNNDFDEIEILRNCGNNSSSGNLYSITESAFLSDTFGELDDFDYNLLH